MILHSQVALAWAVAHTERQIWRQVFPDNKMLNTKF